jgi:hypothetical protein
MQKEKEMFMKPVYFPKIRQILLLLVAVMLSASGCTESRYRKGIEGALQQYASAVTRSNPRTLEGLRAVLSGMQMTDLSDCPEDFRMAFLRHSEALNSLATFIASSDTRNSRILGRTLGEGFQNGFWQGIGTLFQEAVKDDQQNETLRKNVIATLNEMIHVAQLHGAKVPA